MTSTIIMPQLGETVTDGKIRAWFKSVGDEIKEGDNLFEVETDKVTMEVQAIVAGRLSEIRVGPGLTAKVGEVVAVIGNGVAKPGGPDDPSEGRPPQGPSPFEEVPPPADRFGNAKGPNGIHLTPLARRLIAQGGLDLTELAAAVQRKGKKRIDGAAVRAAISARPATPNAPPAPVAPPPGPSPIPGRQGDVVTLNTMRQKTGERLAEAWRT